MAVHSQDMNIPDCPRGWDSLWMGYSFAMVCISTFSNLSADQNVRIGIGQFKKYISLGSVGNTTS